jgi:hypothetical protein
VVVSSTGRLSANTPLMRHPPKLPFRASFLVDDDPPTPPEANVNLRESQRIR